MESKRDKKLFKLRLEQCKFASLKRLERDEIERAYRELYKLYQELGIKNELLSNENHALKTQLEQKNKKVNYTNYNPEAKGIDKVIFILKQNSKVMLSHDIVREIILLEPNVKQKWKNPYSSVIKYISRGVGFSRIIQFKKIGSGTYTYGLPEWLKDGLLIPKYKYDG